MAAEAVLWSQIKRVRLTVHPDSSTMQEMRLKPERFDQLSSTIPGKADQVNHHIGFQIGHLLTELPQLISIPSISILICRVDRRRTRHAVDNCTRFP